MFQASKLPKALAVIAVGALCHCRDALKIIVNLQQDIAMPFSSNCHWWPLVKQILRCMLMSSYT